MNVVMLATEHSVLIARPGAPWTVEERLAGLAPACLSADQGDGARVYCGTSGHGVWRSADAGRNWEAVPGLERADVTAVAVSPTERVDALGVVYVGTEPSALFRSSDGGETWREAAGLRRLESAPTWSFPPRPETHHVRWIEPDAAVPGRVFVAIEAGALVRTDDAGRTWRDRVAGGPYDTHTAATQPRAPGRVYSAAGDGYFESRDAGETWQRRVDGLRHHYLIGIAVDPEDPETVVASAAAGPRTAYRPAHADAFVYRRARGATWTLSMAGLPEPRGTTASRFAVDPDSRTMYAANNRGVFRSLDAGRTWTALDVPWPPGTGAFGVHAIAVLPATV